MGEQHGAFPQTARGKIQSSLLMNKPVITVQIGFFISDVSKPNLCLIHTVATIAGVVGNACAVLGFEGQKNAMPE